MFEYFNESELFTVYHYDFFPSHSCTSQLLSIIHETLKSLDESLPIYVRGVFLNISKAFEKGCHKGLIYELKSYGIFGNVLQLIENYLTN